MSPPSDPGVFSVTLPARPYPGLRPFGKDEWPIFFGRERMADDVVERLVKGRMLVVHGDSGCGKSSLIRAAVLPRLEQESARGGGRWVTHIATPGDDPLGNLARALAAGRGDAETLNLRRILNCGADGAQRLVDDVCGRESTYVCVLIDQFEEIFAHAHRRGPQQAALLIDQLLGLQQLDTDQLYVVLTMRSEFLGACAKFDGFAAAVNRTQYLLPRMEHGDLVRAIREPATLYEGEIAADLAERLIAEARGSQDELPLIQHGLMQLHAQHVGPDATSWRLALEHYRYPGGLAGLLSAHADAVMAQVEPEAGGREGPRVTEDLFRALTDINADNQATRNPQRLRDLIAVTGSDDPTVRGILDAFRAEGVSFVRPYATDAVPSRPIGLDEYVDISHEALIRGWARLADQNDGWLAREFKNGLIWRSLLVQAESFERDPSNVLSAATAEERSIWLQRRNPEWAKRYGGGWPRVVALVERSMAEREKAERARLAEEALKSELAIAVEKSRRAKLFRWGMVGALILFGFAAVAAWYAQMESTRAKQAERQAHDAAAFARREESRAQAALQEAQKQTLLANQQRERAEATTEVTKAELDKLRRSAGGGLQKQIDDAGYSITAGVNARLSPRLYIKITGEHQRAPALELKRRIETTRLGTWSLTVPGIEVVGHTPRAQLRCFVAEECQRYGQPLVDLVNGWLSAPKLSLVDRSAIKVPDGAIRPLHFEIYFPSMPLVLEAAGAKASSY